MVIFQKYGQKVLFVQSIKKDSNNIADNYRNITVIPVLSKICESVFNFWLSFRNIVLEKDDNMQFGFNTNH